MFVGGQTNRQTYVSIAGPGHGRQLNRWVTSANPTDWSHGACTLTALRVMSSLTGPQGGEMRPLANDERSYSCSRPTM